MYGDNTDNITVCFYGRCVLTYCLVINIMLGKLNFISIIYMKMVPSRYLMNIK